MAFKLGDRIRETSTTTGTGSLTLAGAVTGFATFASVLSTGDTTWYAIVLGANWEVGLGTFTSPGTLARTAVLASTNGGAAVSFAGGDKDVFITTPASALSWLEAVTPAGKAMASAASAIAQRILLGDAGLEALGARIMNVNSWMEHDQEFAGTGQTVATNGLGYYVTDNHLSSKNSAGALALYAQRCPDPWAAVSGFQRIRFAHQCYNTALQASFGAAEYGRPFCEAVEGSNLRGLAWGTASAKDLDVLIIASSNLAGNFPLAIYGGSPVQSYVTMVPLPGGGAPVAYLTRIPGPTTGTWDTNTAALGFTFDFGFVSGTTFHTPSLGAWATGAFISHASAANWCAVFGNDVTVGLCAMLPAGAAGIAPGAVTGSALNQLMSMRRSPDEELLRCQRYFSKTISDLRGPAPGAGNYFEQPLYLPSTMRSVPTTSITTAGSRTNVNLPSVSVSAIDLRTVRFSLASTAAGDTFSIGDIITANARV